MYDATTAAFSWMIFPTNASSSSTGGIPAPRSAAKSVLSDAYCRRNRGQCSIDLGNMLPSLPGPIPLVWACNPPCG
jgi:hypothetical protein